MCGIVGYIGNKPAQPILLGGLKRLEYRGYDSSGVATLEANNPEIIKAKGKLINLTAKTKNSKSTGNIGIGHTRWATHGEPNEQNAHPHQVGKIILVHNGIIENFTELKSQYNLKTVSDTDTEVLAALIEHEYSASSDLHEAINAALKQVRGTFGLVVMATDQPNTLVAARRGSPLIIGTNKKEIFVGSDASALVGHAKDVMYLNDDEVAVMSDGQVQVYDLERMPQKRSKEQLNLELEELQKQGYDHFLIKEIMEQPQSVEATLRGHLLPDEGTTRLGGVNLGDDQIRQIQRILIIGCGTAYYAGLLAKYQLERITDIPVDVEVASEFRYREPVISENTVAIVISQSGETADTLASLKELKRKGVYTHGLVNSIGSTIAREVDGGMYLHVGPEISVASTKAFTSQVIGALLFGLYIARKRSLPFSVGEEIVQALAELPEQIEQALKLDSKIATLSQKYVDFDHALYLGRDAMYPIALEGALKLKEVSYLHAEGYPSGEMKHGPIALIDKNFLSIFLLDDGPLFEKSRTNLEEIKARGGEVLVITNSVEYAKNDPSSLQIKTKSHWTAPLVLNVALQLLAYHIALKRGTDVDQPRNLAKSVTVE